MTVPQAIRTRTFWQLCVIFFCVAGCVTGAITHLVPLLTDRGVSGKSAALAMSLFGLGSIVGRVGNGYLVDRFFAPRMAAAFFAAAAVGVALLLGGGTGNIPAVAATLLGLAVGAEGDVVPFLVSRYFGMRSMAELFGFAFAAYVLGNATGRYLFGAGFDATGSYRVPLIAALFLLMVASAATLTLGPYARPDQQRSAARARLVSVLRRYPLGDGTWLRGQCALVVAAFPLVVLLDPHLPHRELSMGTARDLRYPPGR